MFQEKKKDAAVWLFFLSATQGRSWPLLIASSRRFLRTESTMYVLWHNVALFNSYTMWFWCLFLFFFLNANGKFTAAVFDFSPPPRVQRNAQRAVKRSPTLPRLFHRQKKKKTSDLGSRIKSNKKPDCCVISGMFKYEGDRSLFMPMGVMIHPTIYFFFVHKYTKHPCLFTMSFFFLVQFTYHLDLIWEQSKLFLCFISLHNFLVCFTSTKRSFLMSTLSKSNIWLIPF